MTDRAALIEDFIAAAGWKEARCLPLAGDASNRRYLRLVRGTESAVLMDAPPERGEDVRPFVKIANWLAKTGLSAPLVLHKDDKAGLLLLEDLGDDLLARVVARDPSLEQPLYKAAVDVLIALHDQPAPQGLVAYTPALMGEMIAPAYEWYLGGIGQDAATNPLLQSHLKSALEQHCPETDVVILRDYHAENLLWLPGRKGAARVGLLDFQDAMHGHCSYDLVSLLQDIRREVSTELEQDMIRYYLNETGLAPEPFRAAYALQGFQRNLRILGIFARLCLHAGKPQYIDYLPRVWALVQQSLDHPALSKMRQIVLNDFPPPEPEILNKLRAQCPRIPKP